MSGYDSKDLTLGTDEDKSDGAGQLGQDRQDKTGQPEETVRIVQPGKETEDRMSRT
jgi:hypothetical protein